MSQMTPEAQLFERVAALKAQQTQEWQTLRNEFTVVYESLRPINIKQTVGDILAQPTLKTDMIQATIGFAAGYVSKQFIAQPDAHPFRKALGMLAEIGVTRWLLNNE
jgi:hypothetical protein